MEKVATRGQILWLKCTKFDFGWGYAPDPSGGAHSTPPDPLFVLCNTLQYTILSNNFWSCICGSIVPPSKFPLPPENRVLSYGSALTVVPVIAFVFVQINHGDMLHRHFQAWAHKIFIFRTEKNLKFQDIFQDIRVTKNAFFVISGAHNFGTFRANAKITIRRHEVVYRLSSERKMIDLE